MTVLRLGLCLMFGFASTLGIPVFLDGTEPQPFDLVAGLSLRNLGSLESDFWAVSTPGSGQYLQHRSVEEIAKLVGSSDEAIKEASEWFVAHGADADSIRVSPLRDSVTATFQPEAGLGAVQRWGGKLPARAVFPLPVDFLLRRDAAPAVAMRSASPSLGLFGPSVSAQKKAYGVPADLAAKNATTLQMVRNDFGDNHIGVVHDVFVMIASFF